MKHYRFLFLLPFFLTFKPCLCQCDPSMAIEILDSSKYQGINIGDSTRLDSLLCNFLYSQNITNDTLHYSFEDKEDFGPVYLSNDELNQIYCEIKRGNIEAYRILCLHFFYSHAQNNSVSDLDKMICVTDYLAQKFFYYSGYLICGNYIFDYLCSGFNANDYYVTTMITYYEKYFEVSKSKNIAQKLYDIYCGNYPFHDIDSVNAKYYEFFIYNK